ncbi:PIN domain-containing protein [Candidatus Micrarchaeota archaeon]|nr:PIN domain-containing protein [Candidatus Micrarchaeota archaeon]MBD3417937.1 PIN domain-containing protein [Candidatus Micrarchaeota archaeon]
MATKICLDTDVVLDFFKGDMKTVQKIKQYSQADKLCLTSLSYFELLTVIRGSPRWEIVNIVEKMEMLDFDRKAAVRASKIYENAVETHLQLGMRELVIASVCISNKALLLTGKRQPYEGIKGLKFV